MIIDAKDAILGRLATHVATQLKKGESVEIVNAENAIITGDPEIIEKKYLERTARGSPQHGPFYPKRPDMIVRRAVRGMINYKKPSGTAAYKRLKVHIGVPKELEGKEMFLFSEKQKPVECQFARIGKIARKIGWKGEQ